MVQNMITTVPTGTHQSPHGEPPSHGYTVKYSILYKFMCAAVVMLLLSQNIKIERCILILGINIEPDDLADLRKSINRLDVYCAASSG